LAVLDDRDRRRYHDEAEALLSRGSWAADDVDHAIWLHDQLETPEGTPDPVARKLRARLARELERRLAAGDNPAYRVRYEVYSSLLLERPDPFARRLFLLLYRGMTNFLGYESGAHGQLDVAIDAFLQLDRAVTAEWPRASAVLGDSYHAALMGLAAACSVRYSGRRELLHGDLHADVEREIRADLDRAIAASERAVGASNNPAARASALGALGSCHVFRYEDDQRHSGPETIDTAVTFLREAVQLAETTVRETRGGQQRSTTCVASGTGSPGPWRYGTPCRMSMPQSRCTSGTGTRRPRSGPV